MRPSRVPRPIPEGWPLRKRFWADLQGAQTPETPASATGLCLAEVARARCIPSWAVLAKRLCQSSSHEGTRSCLVYEALRLATSTLASFLFIENVDHVRFVHPGAATLVESLCALGYFCRWVSLSAANAGSPQRRQRWFLLASREAQFELAVPADSGLALLIEQSSGVSFNGGRPPVRKWMVPKQSPSSEVDLRLSLLGNSVVPLQVALAARLLSR